MVTRVGTAQDGAAVTVAPGDVLEIALPENASTGYRWELSPLPPGMAPAGDRTEAAAPATPGAIALRVFTVHTGHGGTVAARLRRPWESVEPARTFSVRVSCPPAGTPP